MRSPRRTRCPAYLALALGAVALGTVLQSAAAQEKPGGPASKIENEGWRQYMANCARCHGDDAVGGAIAVDLRAVVATGAVDSASFVSIVKAGRPAAGMPPFKDILKDEQIAAIYAYVKARAEKRLPAGRPAQPR
jgi:mono/diheme cytochrome c family protein